MSAPKRNTKLKREKALEETERLHLRGYSQNAIAKKLGVSQSQVNYDIKKVRERYKEEALEHHAVYVREKINQLRAVAQEAWEGWERSKKQALEIREEEGTTGEGGWSKTSKTKKRVSGACEYLRTILDCLKQEAELLGLEAPKRVDANMNVINWDALASEIDNSPDLIEVKLNEALNGIPRQIESNGNGRH